MPLATQHAFPVQRRAVVPYDYYCLKRDCRA